MKNGDFQVGKYEKGADGRYTTPSTPSWFKLLSEQVCVFIQK